MKEKFVAAPKQEMFLDESLYELSVEEARYECEKRERKGVMTTIGRFFKTPTGKTVAAAYLSASAYTNVHIAHEYLTRSPTNIYEVENAPPSPDSFAGDRPLDEVRNELTKWLGEETVRDLVPVTSSDRDRATRERRREEIRSESVADVEGFDAVGISDESVEHYLEEGFPRFMTAEGNVSSIEFTTEHVPMREDYHLGTGAETAGSCSVAEADEASVIRMYGALLDSDGRLEVEQTFRDVLLHELAHAIDWENLEAVDPATRTRMLHQMVSHVRDEESRLRFSYVERISSDDPQEELRNRTVEYYAEFTANVFKFAPPESADDPSWVSDTAEALIRAYGNSDSADHKNHLAYVLRVQNDVELVREVVRAFEPTFNWETAAQTRVHFLDKMRTERTLHELTEAAGGIASGPARELVQELIENSRETITGRDYFIRRAGTDYPETENMGDADMLTRANVVAGRALEHEIMSVQIEAVRNLEREILPGDMPAYRALTVLLEIWPDFFPRNTTAEQMNRIRSRIEDYRSAARNASPAHVEAARHHFEIIQGTRDFPADLNARINRYLDEIDFVERS